MPILAPSVKKNQHPWVLVQVGLLPERNTHFSMKPPDASCICGLPCWNSSKQPWNSSKALPSTQLAACKSHWKGFAKLHRRSLHDIFCRFLFPFKNCMLKKVSKSYFLWPSEKSWEELKRCEKRREEMRRHEVSCKALRRAEKNWEILRRGEISWAGMSWDYLTREVWGAEKSWVETTCVEWGNWEDLKREWIIQMNWEEIRKTQMTWEERTIVISGEEFRKGEKTWDEMRWGANAEKTPREMRWDADCSGNGMWWTVFKIQKRSRRMGKSSNCCCEAQKAWPHPTGTALVPLLPGYYWYAGVSQEQQHRM